MNELREYEAKHWLEQAAYFEARLTEAEAQLKSSLAANRELRKEYDELRLAVRVNHDEEMQELSDIGVPECPLHGGYCAPHVGKWMRETKECAEKAEAANREQKAEIERLQAALVCKEAEVELTLNRYRELASKRCSCGRSEALATIPAVQGMDK